MKKQIRPFVTGEHIEMATNELETAFRQKVASKGDGAFISNHEALGAITEEYGELLLAIRSGGDFEFSGELIDLALACIYGMASIYAREQR